MLFFSLSTQKVVMLVPNARFKPSPEHAVIKGIYHNFQSTCSEGVTDSI